MNPLKPRQERFCRRFAELGCATPRENIGASFATVPAAARNDDFCFGGKLF